MTKGIYNLLACFPPDEAAIETNELESISSNENIKQAYNLGLIQKTEKIKGYCLTKKGREILEKYYTRDSRSSWKLSVVSKLIIGLSLIAAVILVIYAIKEDAGIVFLYAVGILFSSAVFTEILKAVGEICDELVRIRICLEMQEPDKPDESSSV